MPVHECIACGGAAEYIGTLGSLNHYRCRSCGAQFPVEASEDYYDPQEDIDSQ